MRLERDRLIIAGHWCSFTLATTARWSAFIIGSAIELLSGLRLCAGGRAIIGGAGGLGAGVRVDAGFGHSVFVRRVAAAIVVRRLSGTAAAAFLLVFTVFIVVTIVTSFRIFTLYRFSVVVAVVTAIALPPTILSIAATIVRVTSTATAPRLGRFFDNFWLFFF